MVVEGGWTSASVGGVVSSPATQARYIRRQAQLLDQARARFVFQLTFTDLDLSGMPPGSNLQFFASLGLVDVTIAPKNGAPRRCAGRRRAGTNAYAIFGARGAATLAMTNPASSMPISVSAIIVSTQRAG